MVGIGGFFASLKLVTDENSFRQGIGVLEKFPSKLKGLAVGAAGLAAGMVALATSTATAMTKLDAQARTLGMSARTLDNWRGAVGLAGGDADSFVSSMVSMNEAFRNLKIGEVKTDFITATGMSGADFSKLQGMNNDQRLRTIWSALDRVSDTQKQQALREKIFGAGGVELASLLQAKGTSLFGLYNQAASLNPLSDADYAGAIEGDKKQREIAQSLEKTFQNLGIKIEQALLPALTKLADWFASHQKELDDFATAVGNATSSVISFFSWFGANKQGQQNQALSFMLGGDKFAQAFQDLATLKKIEIDPAKDKTGGAFGLLMSPEWHRLSEAIKGGGVGASFSDDLKAKGVSTSTMAAFQTFANAIAARGVSSAEQFLREDKLMQGLAVKPNMNLTVIIEKDNSVTIKDTDTGKVLQNVKAVSQATSGLR